MGDDGGWCWQTVGVICVSFFFLVFFFGQNTCIWAFFFLLSLLASLGLFHKDKSSWALIYFFYGLWRDKFKLIQMTNLSPYKKNEWDLFLNKFAKHHTGDIFWLLFDRFLPLRSCAKISARFCVNVAARWRWGLSWVPRLPLITRNSAFERYILAMCKYPI